MGEDGAVSTGARIGYVNLEDAHRLLPVTSRHTLELCARVFADFPHLMEKLPCGVSLVEYGFKSDHDFETACEQFRKFG